MEYELYHHGILGMKWGIRRYQNKDGSLTAAGKKRYGTDEYTGQQVKKSKTTRAFEKLESSSREHAEKQDRLYKQTGNEYHKKSAEQWRKEADEYKKNAEASFKNDATKKLRPDLYKKQQEWDKNYKENYQKNWLEAYNKTADYANKVLIPRLEKKYGTKFDGFDYSSKKSSALNYELTSLLDKYMNTTMKQLTGERPDVEIKKK